jgi:trimeric autotransporter adhesin
MRVVLGFAFLLITACADTETSEDGETRPIDVGQRGDLRPVAAPDVAAADDQRLAGGGGSLAHRAFLKVVSDEFAEFGYPIALDGDTMLVGAPFTDVGYDSDGAVFVFVRRDGVWSQEARLNLPYEELDDGQYFGTSVSIQGDVAAIGAPLQGNGRVHLFERSGTEWTRTAVLGPPFEQPDFLGEFGQALKLDGDVLAVGARGDSSASTGVGGDPTNQDAPYSGAVHVFVRDGADWVHDAYIKASNTTAEDGFGGSLALSGDTLAIASNDDSSATGVNGDDGNKDSPGSGAVFVFQRGADGWAQQAYVKASNTGAEDSFGTAYWPDQGVTLDGDTLVVSAVREDSAATGVGGDQTSNEATDSGAVYVFTRSDETWAQQAYVKASNTEAEDLFGSRTALSGDRLAVSAVFEDSAATGIGGDQTSNAAENAGAVYFFRRSGGWTQTHYIKATSTAALDTFGWGLAWDGTFLAVGSEGQVTCPDPDPDDHCNQRGAVYVLR